VRLRSILGDLGSRGLGCRIIGLGHLCAKMKNILSVLMPLSRALETGLASPGAGLCSVGQWVLNLGLDRGLRSRRQQGFDHLVMQDPQRHPGSKPLGGGLLTTAGLGPASPLLGFFRSYAARRGPYSDSAGPLRERTFPASGGKPRTLLERETGLRGPGRRKACGLG